MVKKTHRVPVRKDRGGGKRQRTRGGERPRPTESETSMSDCGPVEDFKTPRDAKGGRGGMDMDERKPGVSHPLIGLELMSAPLNPSRGSLEDRGRGKEDIQARHDTR